MKKPSSDKTPSRETKRATNSNRAPATVRQPQRVSAEMNLAVTLRDRINLELDAQGVPAIRRPSYLAILTGRAAPSCRRWLDPDAPGLPDLQSFSALCLQFEADANYFLGFTSTRLSSTLTRGSTLKSSTGQEALESAQWVERVANALEGDPAVCTMVVMQGDEMWPKISDGDIVFIDQRVNALQGNGTYYLEFDGARFIRNVELRLAEGVVLSCNNPKYRDTQVPSESKERLVFLGRVRKSVSVLTY